MSVITAIGRVVVIGFLSIFITFTMLTMSVDMFTSLQSISSLLDKTD